jgi:hypothetical protein
MAFQSWAMRTSGQTPKQAQTRFNAFFFFFSENKRDELEKTLANLWSGKRITE